jgi:hypothetical protein
MKIKNIVTVLLVAIILASCAPAAAITPAETTVPTAIFIPTQATLESTSQPEVPVTETPVPFIVNTVITEQQTLSHGYSTEMAKYLAGSTIEDRSGLLTGIKNGKVIAYVNEKTGKWERVEDFVLATNHEEAQTSCKISENQVDAWFIFAKLNDSTGEFSDKVIHWQLGVSHILGGPASPAHVYWWGNEQDSNPWRQFADPNVSPFKRVAYCTVDRLSWFETIRLVKYLNPSGNISWFMIAGPGGSDNRYGDFPIIPEENPSIAKPLSDWAASGGQNDFPQELEGKLLREIY